MKTLRLTLCGACVAGALMLSDVSNVGAQSSGSAAAASEIRFQQLEKEIRRLTGQIEEQNYEIRRLREELARVSGDVDVRLRDVENGTGGSVSSYTAGGGKYRTSDENKPFTQPIPKVDSNSSFQYQPPVQQDQRLGTLNMPKGGQGDVSSADSAPRAYEYAYSFIKARDFDRAEKEFGAFINSYGSHPLVSNAKYWYGETFYVRGSYEKAARIFAEGYQQYPKAPKAASNLLKLGMSLKGMGKRDDACVAFKQLKKEYKSSSVPVLKRADTEMKSINCR